MKLNDIMQVISGMTNITVKLKEETVIVISGHWHGIEFSKNGYGNCKVLKVNPIEKGILEITISVE